MRFELRSDNPYAGMTVRIAYPSAMSRKIIKDDQTVEMNDWVEGPASYGDTQFPNGMYGEVQ